ncbi:hypothetical protein [Cellulomonas palmilytica]|uniref:hypothetical protein n=1 Tax=Cellulomonas palmilytica TaxID=2608402 RepID=UPI001F2295D8|nr:hypothetical protein [Cellulomonas palmilytica]UJP39517.1 hypothetical protein F1D97_14500 [Cellulomonas palmilytica]
MTGPQDADQTPTWAAPGSTPSTSPTPPAPGAPGAPPAAPGAAPQPGAWGPAPGTPPPAPYPPADQAAPGYGPGYGPAPAYGTPTPPGHGPAPAGYGPTPPGYGPTAPGYGPAGWQPPAARPGIIPLRPLNLGEILDGAFRAVRANPAVMFGLSFAVVAVAVLLQGILTWYVGGLLAQEWSTALDDPNLADTGLADEGASTLGATSALLLTQPITALATTILTGLLIVSVSRSVIARKATMSEILRSGRVWHVVGFSLLQGTAVTVVGAVGIGLGVLLATQTSWGWVLLYGLVAGLAFVVAVIWFAVRTLLVPAALMLEQRRFWPTVARAWRLTRGSFWRLFGIQLLAGLIAWVVSQIIQVPVVLVLTFVLGTSDSLSGGAIAVTSIGNVLALTLTTVFTATVVALLYIDTRMRREGLDIELARAAEQTA